MNDTLLLENYSDFFLENEEYRQDASRAVNLITDPTEYAAYTEALLEGYDESIQKGVRGLFDRNREFLMESSTSMLGSPEAIAYATASFALILDVFTDDLLSRAITVAPSKTPTKTVTRIRWEGKVIDVDGSSTSYIMPTGKNQVRPGLKSLTVVKGSDNIFTLAGITANTDDYRIIQRNFRVVGAAVNDGTTDHDVEFTSSIDARGNFTADDVKVVVDGTNDATVKISGQVNFTTGEITHGMVVTDITGAKTYTLTNITVKTRILGQGNSKGTVKATPKAVATDFIMDVSDSFEIENHAELIQDWSAVYNLDIFASLKTVVKQQISLNKNFDIVDILDAAIPEMTKLGAYKTIDMDVLGAKISGAKLSDFYASIIPGIMSVAHTVGKNSSMKPNYLICDAESSIALKSLQDVAIGFNNKETGSFGGSNVVNDFVSMQIIPTDAIDTAGRIYIVAKSTAENETGILDLEYQPLYFQTEVTNGKNRLFVRSRSDVRLIKAEAVGALDIKNLSNWSA